MNKMQENPEFWLKEYGKNDKIVSRKQLGERMRTGKLFVISGPSGTGKGTICNGVLADMEGMELSISMQEFSDICVDCKGQRPPPQLR